MNVRIPIEVYRTPSSKSTSRDRMFEWECLLWKIWKLQEKFNFVGEFDKTDFEDDLFRPKYPFPFIMIIKYMI